MSPKQVKAVSGFASRITLRNGRVIYAADYGYKAFPLHFRRKR